MKLGEKIRTARLNAGMTQAELAGDFITRNMLSQIENGLAMPSLQTALYISDKLGIDAGLLFSDSDNREAYFLTRKLPELKKLFEKKDYDGCIELCSEGAEECDEAVLLLAECHIKKAYEAFDLGKLRQAMRHSENAVKFSSKTIYSAEGIKYKAELLEAAIATIVPFVKQTKHKPEEKLYLFERFVELADKKTVYLRLKDARSLSDSGKYEEALEILRELLREKDIGVPFEYALCCEYEICCRELKDYENAYNYSQTAKRLLVDMQQ